MDSTNLLLEFLRSAKLLTTSNRPIHMRLAHSEGLPDDALLPQLITGSESMCGGLDYRIECLSMDATLPLKQFIALPAEIQLVTDRGDVRKICGIVTQAIAGNSDGGLATYLLVIRDALAIMEQRTNTRIFRNANEVDIIETIFEEWRQKNSIFAAAFELEIDPLLFQRQYPKREFTKQHNESDAAFLRRLMRRRGIAWYVKAGRPGSEDRGVSHDDAPAHTLVLFNDSGKLQQNRAGEIRFHRDGATEQRDSVISLAAVRNLRPATVSRHSWDYMNPRGGQFMSVNARSASDQGPNGNLMSASLTDYLIEGPHVGNDQEDHASLGQLRLDRFDYETKCFRGESSVRDLCVGEINAIADHPELDLHPDAEREFIITELSVVAENNLGSANQDGIRKLLARNRWNEGAQDLAKAICGDDGVRYRNRFTCVRKGVPLSPAYDRKVDVPVAHIESALVVGPPGERIHCDPLGRIKIRFSGTREEDHVHASGAGASNTGGDSAWVRVASNWAGPGSASAQAGALGLPRVGSEVLIAYLDGDPDRPVVIGQMYNKDAPPPGLNNTGGLPGNRFVSGIQSTEINGTRHNQLRLDDTPGEISAQLSSDHGTSEVNLGRLTQRRHEGKAEGRGEGAEMRSDHAVSVRGAEGVLLTADGRKDASGRLLDRHELIGLVEVLGSVANELSTLAANHELDDQECPQLAKLKEMLKAWDRADGTSTASPASNVAGPGAPIIAASAPAGIVIGSQDAIVMGAASKVDVVSVADTAVSAGRKLLMRATESVSIFALKLGLKLVAASGDIKVQSHDGHIELVALKRLKLTAGEGIDIEAPEARLVTKGTQVDWRDGRITQQCKGEFAVKAAKFLRTGAGDGTPEDVLFPKSELETDERVIVREQQTGRPIPGMHYTAKFEDGRVESGVTDAEGRTQVFRGTDFGNIEITFDD